MINKKNTVLLIFNLVIALTSNASSSENPLKNDNTTINSSIPLASQWIISRYVVGAKIVYAESKSAYIGISTDLSSFSGSGGCNSLRGSMFVSGKNLRFDSIVSTKMFCDNMESENRFLNTLGQVKTYKIVGAELFLYNKNKKLIMVLESYR